VDVQRDTTRSPRLAHSSFFLFNQKWGGERGKTKTFEMLPAVSRNLTTESRKEGEEGEEKGLPGVCSATEGHFRLTNDFLKCKYL